MRPFWQTGFGKLVIGSCGAQIGLLLSLGGLVVVVLFCAVCLVTNVISLGLTRGLLETSSSATIPAAATSSPAEVGSLLEQVNALLTEVEALQLEEPIALPPPVVAGGKPVIIAGQNPVSLYSSPDIEAEPVALLPTGASVEIVGRNNSSTWWLVALSDGRFAWAFNALVTALNVNDTIPVVTTPSELAQPASFSLVADVTPLPPIEPLPPTVTPAPTLPPGTPTPAAEASRQYIEDTPAYQRVRASLLVPPVSASFSPDGSQFAMTERIRLYTIGIAGAYTEIWLEDTDREGPVGNVVWSPDGKYIAFVLGFKQHRYCRPCRAVGLLNLAEKSITYLMPPDPKLDTDMPRWTQDGRLLINAHPGEPASGVAYVYNIYGEYQKADGIYTLSASHEGQKWFPWRPGRVWQAGVSERADSYNSD